jgi:hypothetical protein
MPGVDFPQENLDILVSDVKVDESGNPVVENANKEGRD